jgi:hypothetical protein
MPVHERAVKCPHCGGATGVSADASLTAEERRAAVDLARAESDRNVAGDPYSSSYDYRYDPELALVGGVALAAAAVGVVVKSAVEAVVDERKDRESRPELPRATARERAAPPIAPEPSKAPEPAPPPSDTPRFLK